MAVAIKHGTHIRERCGVGFRVVDNTECGLTQDEVELVVDVASREPIYWNDVDCYHWMFDFKVGSHWCEGLFGEDVMEQFGQENPYDTLNINVYE